MKWHHPIVFGTLLRREKRFLAEIKLNSGKVVWVHCANPGSMRGNAIPGSRVWLYDFGETHLEQGKKLRYRWVVIETEDSKVCVDTSAGNKVLEEEILKIPDFTKFIGKDGKVSREVSIGNSRLDFCLESSSNKKYFIELKSVSMGSENTAYFPDSVTKRGQKHIQELLTIWKSGVDAGLFFLVMREDSEKMEPAKEIDPEYARLLALAIKDGLKVLAYKVKITKEGIFIDKKIPVVV